MNKNFKKLSIFLTKIWKWIKVQNLIYKWINDFEKKLVQLTSNLSSQISWHKFPFEMLEKKFKNILKIENLKIELISFSQIIFNDLKAIVPTKKTSIKKIILSLFWENLKISFFKNYLKNVGYTFEFLKIQIKFWKCLEKIFPLIAEADTVKFL